MKLIVGAKDTAAGGWVSTDKRHPGAPLDVRRPEDWARVSPPASVDRILAEHVLEHMTLADAQVALCNMFRAVKPGGIARIAVPDANNPDPVYQEHCRPGGRGQSWARLLFYQADEPEHKTHFDYKTLSELMRRAGFEPRLLEWFDEHGQFHRNPWSLADGPVRRYYNSPYNLQVYLPFHGFQNLSLIVDGVKPADARGGAVDAGRCEMAIGSRAVVNEAPAARDSTGTLLLLGALAAGVLAWRAWR